MQYQAGAKGIKFTLSDVLEPASARNPPTLPGALIHQLLQKARFHKLRGCKRAQLLLGGKLVKPDGIVFVERTRVGVLALE